MIKKTILTFCCLFFIRTYIHATAQISDIICINNKAYSLFSTPMDEYFRKHQDKRPNAEIICTGLWRGYRATFEISDNKLYLTDIEILTSDESGEMSTGMVFKSVFSDIFPEKMFLNYYTGTLIIPDGELLAYIHMGFYSAYESYIIIEIKNGKVISEKRHDYSSDIEFLKSNYELFRKMEEYREEEKAFRKNLKISIPLDWDLDDSNMLPKIIGTYSTPWCIAFGAICVTRGAAQNRRYQ